MHRTDEFADGYGIRDYLSRFERERERITAVRRRFHWMFYVPMWVMVLAFAAPPFEEWKEADNKATIANLADIPDATIADLKSEWELIHKEVRADGDPKRPQAYFEFLVKRDAWDRKADKYIAQQKDYSQDYNWVITRKTNQMAVTQELIQTYKAKFGGDVKWSEIAAAWHKDNPRKFPAPRKQTPRDLTRFWEEFLIAYAKMAAVFMFGIFPLWTIRHGLKLWYECWWRIPIASATFFASWAVYPVRIDRTRQGQQAIQFACLAISAVVSLFGGGAQIAKAQNGPVGSKSNATQKAKSGRFGGSVSGAIELYPVTNGREKGKLVSPQAFGTFRAPGVVGSFFGFTENGDVPFFTNVSANVASPHAPALAYSFEIGGTAKGAFTQSGIKVAPPKLPIIGRHVRKALPFITLGRFWRTSGGDSQETHIAWATAKVPLGKELRLHSEGMLRFRSGRGSSNDVGQPQMWLSLKSLPRWKLGVEIWKSGSTYTPRFGLMYSH